MPRKKQRYSNLLKELRGVGNSNPTDGRTGNFLRFLTGQRRITQTNTIPVEARQLYAVGLIPFGLSAANTTPEERYLATISAYSLKGLQERATGLSEDKLGIYKIVGGERENKNYYPALIKAKFATSSVGVIEEKTSAITGETYRYDYNRTFSFPFGRTTTATDAETGAAETTIDDVDELDVYRFALNDINSPNDPNNKPVSVSYEAEIFKTDNKGTAYETNTTLPNFSVN